MATIKSFSVGDGDMFYIDHGSDNFSMIDCRLTGRRDDEILDELQKLSNRKGITRFISTHPDEDHLLGLKAIDDRLGLNNFYCVENQAAKLDPSDDFLHYKTLRDGKKAYYLSKGCTRKWMNQRDDDRGSAGINVRWPVTSNVDYKKALETAKKGGSPNNLSVILTYSQLDGVTAAWMGDLETDFMQKVQEDVGWVKVNILFAPHHGRKSGRVPTNALKKMAPEIIVVGEAPSEHLHYYADYNTITQNSAGDLLFECDNKFVDVYCSETRYSVTFLKKFSRSKANWNYLGTLEL